MYLRDRIAERDDSKLVEIGIENFEVSAKKVQRIIDQSYEVIVVCNQGNEVVGFLSYRLRVNDMILVDYVMLRNDLQGNGIARSLLPAFEKHIRNKGISTIYGFVHHENMQGLESLKRLGFEVKGAVLTNYIIEKKLQHAPPENSLTNSFRKRLTPPPRLRRR